ncbi:MAG: chemical-damaging agent resistance protein C [Epulopiscium sp. Nuni2H_MBin001]|nr:MAG: chemical-damaging agent resistance protein C [Epulopiscium sp. Nuni2H_MBin001]
MAISLRKGQKVDLTKTNPGLSKLVVGLGWDLNRFDGMQDFDLDTSIFLAGANGRVTCEDDFIFYGNLSHNSGGVTHKGDNRTGVGEGDDELILVNLANVPANIEKVVFTVTIYDAEQRNQNFGQVSNAFIRILDETNGTELVRYDLGEDFSIETALVVGELYRSRGEWKFAAIGSGYGGGLSALCNSYGVNV